MNESLNPKALNDLGDACFYGVNRPVNLELAYSYYKQAADKDNPVGYYNLGNYFIAKKDYKQAIINYEKSKAFDYSPAAITLAKMYQNGYGVKKNKKKAYKYLVNAAKLNDPDAFNALGDCLMKGIGCQKSSEEAILFYQKSADLNNPTGQLNVGIYHLSQKDYKKNPEKAFHWLDKAASNGETTAMKTMMSIYLEGKHPYFKKKSQGYLHEMAFYYRELLAKAKDIEQLKIVANVYYEGNTITKKNYEKACFYFQALKDLNDPEGYYGFGVCLLYGQGIKQNIDEARKYLELASQAKHPKALSRLGDIHRMGMKTSTNAEKAKEFYMEASRLQDPEALVNLGLLNYREQIENHSKTLAYSYMETAAKKGYYQAMYWLGVFHDKGVGCSHDFKTAEKWFEKAIKAGSLGAKYKYATMIIDEIENEKFNQKKMNQYYLKAKELLIDYVLDPEHNQNNYSFAMYYLGQLFKDGKGVARSLRTARYWFEMAAETKLSKAMVEVFLFLKPIEPKYAMTWLNEALKDPLSSEAFYEMGNLYLEGYSPFVESNIAQAKKYYEQAARLNHPKALEKLMMN